ncbi:MAG: hypothetical protein GY778_13675 [bacterium]|nr:hypothetical protein [bacterium]
MVTMKMKSLFFDSPKVKRAVGDATRRVLSQAGAFIRTTARRSMRKARQMRLSEMPDDQRRAYKRRARLAKVWGQPRPKKPLAPSKPGEPPRVRKGQIKRLLYFAWDPTRRSVVAGPERFKKGQTPHVLEYGGTSTVRRPSKYGWEKHRVYVKPRPFMGPALAKERPRLPRRWRNSVRG